MPYFIFFKMELVICFNQTVFLIWEPDIRNCLNFLTFSLFLLLLKLQLNECNKKPFPEEGNINFETN